MLNVGISSSLVIPLAPQQLYLLPLKKLHYYKHLDGKMDKWELNNALNYKNIHISQHYFYVGLIRSYSSYGLCCIRSYTSCFPASRGSKIFLELELAPWPPPWLAWDTSLLRSVQDLVRFVASSNRLRRGLFYRITTIFG